MKTLFPIKSVISLAALALLTACPGGSKDDKPPPSTTITVSVSPSTASLQVGHTQQFTATVSGTTNTGVTWSVAPGGAGGTISPQGLYTAPGTAGTDSVVATSSADATRTGRATVTVTAPAGSTLNYTDPPSGTMFRFVKNTSLSTQTLLVLDLVSVNPQNAAGLAFTVSLGNTNAVEWVKVAPADPMHVQNGTVFTLGSPAALKSTVSGAQLKAVVAQEGMVGLRALNGGPLARIAISAKAGAPQGAVSLSANKFQVTYANRSVETVPAGGVAFGALSVGGN